MTDFITNYFDFTLIGNRKELILLLLFLFFHSFVNGPSCCYTTIVLNSKLSLTNFVTSYCDFPLIHWEKSWFCCCFVLFVFIRYQPRLLLVCYTTKLSVTDLITSYSDFTLIIYNRKELILLLVLLLLLFVLFFFSRLPWLLLHY